MSAPGLTVGIGAPWWEFGRSFRRGRRRFRRIGKSLSVRGLRPAQEAQQQGRQALTLLRLGTRGAILPGTRPSRLGLRRRRRQFLVVGAKHFYVGEGDLQRIELEDPTGLQLAIMEVLRQLDGPRPDYRACGLR